MPDSTAPKMRQLIVPAAVWPQIEHALAKVGFGLARIPDMGQEPDPDDLPTYALVPVDLVERARTAAGLPSADDPCGYCDHRRGDHGFGGTSCTTATESARCACSAFLEARRG